MIAHFQNLSDEEKRLMFEAPVLVSLLVAGADGTIDSMEQDNMLKLAKYRKFTAPIQLQQFYEELEPKFEAMFNDLRKVTGDTPESREKIISAKLSELNYALPKLDSDFAHIYYESLKSFARHIANTSGGTFGFGNISNEERKLIELPMVLEPGTEENI